MPVTTKHPAYLATIDQWTRCRDAFDGSDAVKRAGAIYLPRLSEQTDEEYAAYTKRALWYGATARTVQGLVGAVMRKPPTVKVPAALEPQLTDLTLTGVPFEAFATQVLQEVLLTGRYGVLVDLPSDGVAGSVRPYWVGYRAEAIRNWRVTIHNGKPVITLVVLAEDVTEDSGDGFEVTTVPQYRVLQVDDTGRYVVELWRQQPGSQTAWVRTQTLTPTIRGQRLDYVPFQFFGPMHLTADCEKSPLLDLVDVNFSHYRSSADLEHGRHFCGLPTPWVAGFPETAVLKIGSSIAWVATDPQASAGMLEFTGQGLGALEKALESKEKLMAVLGARLLEEAKQAVEAADTLTLRYSGERSVLQGIARTVGLGLTQLLRWHALWTSLPAPDDLVAQLNQDFVESQLTSDMLTALLQAWQAGGISYETYHYNLERGELMRPGVDAQTERELIQIQQPTTLPLDGPAVGTA